MPATYEPIATTTLGSAASTITFSSIPATYTDLRVVLVATSTVGGLGVTARFNGDSATNYSNTSIVGNGSSASSSRLSSFSSIILASTGTSTTIPSLATMDVFSYTGSTFKTALTEVSEDQNGSGTVYRAVNLYRSTTAISSIALICSGLFAIGTTATLYGIKNA